MNAKLEYEKPNKNLEKWEGAYQSSNGKSINGSPENLLLRGCTLRNIKHAYGVVIYVGKHSKIMMNSATVPDKLSNMIRTMNWILYTIFLMVFLLMALFATLSTIWTA